MLLFSLSSFSAGKPTWLQIGLQAKDQLTGLHVEEADLPVREGCDQVGRFTADQVD